MTDSLPFCSVVVPTHERPAFLRTCLDCLARLDYPRERFEVVVVDDGGRTPLVGEFRELLEIVAVSRSRGEPAAARNTGAERARGALLAFTDDDCRPGPEWLRRLAERFTREPERAIGGRVVNAFGARCSSGSEEPDGRSTPHRSRRQPGSRRLARRAGRRRLRAAIRADGRVVGIRGIACPVGPRRAPAPSPLTPRQSEVLELLAAGLSTREIAGRLAISRETARNHVRGILVALGAHSRLEAVAVARRLGLV